jgi:hypothetical protein
MPLSGGSKALGLSQVQKQAQLAVGPDEDYLQALQRYQCIAEPHHRELAPRKRVPPPKPPPPRQGPQRRGWKGGTRGIHRPGMGPGPNVKVPRGPCHEAIR